MKLFTYMVYGRDLLSNTVLCCWEGGMVVLINGEEVDTRTSSSSVPNGGTMASGKTANDGADET